MQKWEYIVQVSDTPLENQLNVLGNDGWELVSAFHDEGYGWIYYFKRPKS
jgi:hypothetical protein